MSMVWQDFEWSLSRGHTIGEHFYVLGTHDPSLEHDILVSALFCATDGWKQRPLAGIVRGLAPISIPDPATLIGLAHGAAAHWSASQSFVEAPIDPSADGPQAYGELTELCAIAGQAYVLGMGRTIYRLERSGWQRFDDDIRDEGVDEGEFSGLLSLAGFDRNELYTVGFNGEVWRHASGRWSACPRLTNVTLNQACCAGDGLVYVCGQHGVLLVGRDDRFRVIEHGLDQDLWSLAWFRGRLYVSSSHGVFVLVDGDLEPAHDEAGPDGYYRLHADAERLWSIGSKLLLSTTDGSSWQPASPPPEPEPANVSG